MMCHDGVIVEKVSIAISIILLFGFNAVTAESENKSQTLATDNGTLEINLSYNEIILGDFTTLRTDFINPQSQKIQEHIDWTLTITKDDQIVWGPTPLSHTSEGSLKNLKYEFENEGIYNLEFGIEGILFQPIPVETVSFEIIVSEPQKMEEGEMPNWAITLDSMQTATQCAEIVEKSLPDQDWCEKWLESSFEEILEELFNSCSKLNENFSHSTINCEDWLYEITTGAVDVIDETSTYNKIKGYLPTQENLPKASHFGEPENMLPVFSLIEDYGEKIDAVISQTIFQNHDDYPNLSLMTSIIIYEFLTTEDSDYFFNNFLQSNSTQNQRITYLDFPQGTCIRLNDNIDKSSYGSKTFRAFNHCMVDNVMFTVGSSFMGSLPVEKSQDFYPEEKTTQITSIILEKISEHNNLKSITNGNVEIPNWIRNNAEWWAEGAIDDSDFISGIQYLIKEGIMKIPETEQTTSSDDLQEIPLWIKNNAEWWAQGLISDDDFIKGIQYLVEKGIIVV